jgi:arylsulfatase B
VDLYSSTKPARGTNNSLTCSQTAQAGCAYEDDIFTNFTVAQIAANPPGTPLFLYFAPHNVHEPLEAPTAALEQFQFVYDECAAALGLPPLGKNNTCSGQLADPNAPDAKGKGCCFRWYYSTMTNLADAHIGKVVAALKTAGMWDNTLIVRSARNRKKSRRAPNTLNPFSSSPLSSSFFRR